MMPHRRLTFGKYIIEHRRRAGANGGELAALLNDVQTACKLIDVAVARSALRAADPAAAAIDVQGEQQRPLDLTANEIMLKTCEWAGQLSGMVSGELEEPYEIPADYPKGSYLLAFDPLDGSSNIDVNMTAGTIFSVLEAPADPALQGVQRFLQPGTRQIAAGYALYGPVSMLVVTLGNGVHGFTMDREIGAYVLTHPDMRIPPATQEFAIDASNARYWEPPVRRYVEECVEGKAGERGADFTMRWIASMVADIHRILIRGGVFMAPRDSRDAYRNGRLRLLYEANPMAMIVEQAGGAGSTGRERLLDLQPGALHQRSGVFLGSKQEVDRIVRYHAAHDRGDDQKLDAPLFNTRSLFRTA